MSRAHRRRIAIHHHCAAAGVAWSRRDAGERRASGPEGHNRQHQDRAFSPHWHSLSRILTFSILSRSVAFRDLDHKYSFRSRRLNRLLLVGCDPIFFGKPSLQKDKSKDTAYIPKPDRALTLRDPCRRKAATLSITGAQFPSPCLSDDYSCLQPQAEVNMQNGSVIRRSRKNHAYIWQFRWWEKTSDGNRVYTRPN